MAVKGCEAMVHGIKATLDVHHSWVVFQVNVAKAFNTILHKRPVFWSFEQ
jgi:hypothetical protein